MSLYRRGSVYWYDFTVRHKRYRGSTEQTKRTAAEVVEARLKTEAISRRNLPMLSTRSAPLLEQFYCEFEDWLDNSRSSKTGQALDADTKRYYKNGWRLLKTTPVARMRLSDIAKDDIQLLSFPGGPSNTNNALRTLRRMLNRAKDRGIISDVPKFVLAREVERERIFNHDQEHALMEFAPQPLKDVATTIFDTGMRPESVFAMRWENFRWTERVYFVPKSKTHKGRRIVPLSQRLYDAMLTRWKSAGAPECGWVFPCKITKKGKPVSASGHIVSVEKQFLKARTAAKLPSDLVLYSSRHTFGTRLYNRTGNLKVVMAVMGHEETKTTLRYQHPEMDIARQAVDGWNEEAAQKRNDAVATPTSQSASQLIQ